MRFRTKHYHEMRTIAESHDGSDNWTEKEVKGNITSTDVSIMIDGRVLVASSVVHPRDIGRASRKRGLKIAYGRMNKLLSLMSDVNEDLEFHVSHHPETSFWIWFDAAIKASKKYIFEDDVETRLLYAHMRFYTPKTEVYDCYIRLHGILTLRDDLRLDTPPPKKPDSLPTETIEVGKI